MVNFNSWNASSGHDQRKKRAVSASPCRRGSQGNWQDVNGNNSRRGSWAPSGSQECLVGDKQLDLSASAPQHSLEAKLRGRPQRVYSMPHGNLLCVPQAHITPSPSNLEEKENDNKYKLSSSQENLSSYSEPDQEGINVKEHKNISRSKSAGYTVNAQADVSPKNKCTALFSPVKSLIKIMGLSPRGSPRQSPTSSRSPSPGNSPACSSPRDTPTSIFVEN